MSRPKYFTPKEVAAHNTIGDLWVSYLGKVYNLTPLLQKYKGDVLLRPIIESGGKDISHWFDPKTKDGRFVHVPPMSPRTDWANDFRKPWWKDRRYQVGILTAKVRWIRIINTLTGQEQRLEVCSEETLNEILQRYLRYNSHAASYTWKQHGVNLDMSKTLRENGIPDEDEELEHCRLDQDLFTPSICLYYNDDLTEL